MRDEDRYVGQFTPGFSRIHEDGDLWWVVPFRVRYILGICGYRYTGKSLALAHLAERCGFKLYTLSMALREEAQRLGQPLTPRSRLQDLGDRLRAENRDPGYLARVTLRAIRADFLAHQTSAGAPPRVAVGGFKRPEEVDVFASIPQFRLVAIGAHDQPGEDDPCLRFARGRASAGMAKEVAEAGGDPEKVKSDFDAIDYRDREGKVGDASYGQAVRRVVEQVGSSDWIANSANGEHNLFSALNAKVSELDSHYRLPRGL